MEKIQEIFTDEIDDPVVAMRSELDREKLFELADNIKQNGLINPPTVRPIGKRFEIVAGHRRLSACKIAGLIKIQCVVRVLDDQQVFEIKAAENLEREDVDPVDEGNFLFQYQKQSGKNIIEIAKRIKRSAGYVESRISIGQMPDYMQAFLKVGALKLGVALALTQITNPNDCRVWTEMAVRDGVSVAAAEFWLHQWKMSQLPGGSRSDLPPENFDPGVPQPVLFECAVDGKKYDARLMKSFFVYEQNLPFFNEVVKSIRETPEEKEV